MSQLTAAIYAKNVPAWERLTRVAVAVAGAAYALSLPSPWSWAVAASAAGFAVTGLFGFCPACAMMGRPPVRKEPR